MWILMAHLLAFAQTQPISSYAFVKNPAAVHDRLSDRFPTPQGYVRAELKSGSFGAWLRDLPLQADNRVLSYRGEAILAPSAAVAPLDIGRGDIQQCADTVLRLFAEYRWSDGSADTLAFHFTSGDRSGWKDWRRGERFKVRGSKVNRVRRGAVANTHVHFRKWLQHTFLYAGTRSLNKDAKRVAIGEAIQPGDFFVSPGSPGHALIVLDVARAEGKPDVALIGQGFMPAQSFHVITDRGRHVHKGWFELPAGKSGALLNPSWSPLPRTGVYRFP